MRGLAVLATGALLWGLAAGPASADNIRDGQWALQNYHAADRVWPISQGSGVTVAVIDSGVADHQDLTGQVLQGADFPSANSSGRADSIGHGTAMASVIAGHGHGDQSGVMGLAPQAKILPIKIPLSADGFSDNPDSNEDKYVASAIRFAVDHDAKVINMSIGVGVGGNSQPEERDAIKYAVDKDVVLVAATGNFATTVAYPASFPGVVAVGAVDQQGNIWEKSNRGPQVTLTAPGVGIYHAGSKSPTSYVSGDGTSDSAAFVSAIAALVRSKYPNLSAGQVINRLIKSAVPPPDKSTAPNDRYGYGIASPSGALQANPAVDNGPKDNPLLSRPEVSPPSGGDQATAPAATGGNNTATKGSSGSSNTMIYAIGGGVVGLVVIVLVVFLIRRSRNNGGNSGGPGAPGGPGGSGGYAYPPQQPYPPQPQGQQYPQQPPAPPSGGPYQR